MYRSPSPFAPTVDNSRDLYPTSQAVVSPGSITYTTSTGPDGRLIYHPFKAVLASYQTTSGLVNGIQWVPVESTSVLPAGAMPASSDFAASWKRGHKEDKTSDWGRNEEKQRRKDEKDAKRQREEHARVDHDQELRKARERDAQARERRKSFNAGTAAPYAFPASGGGNVGYPGPGYPSNNYAGGGYSASATSDLDHQFGDLDLDRDRDYGGSGRPRKYSTSEAGGDRPRGGRTDAYNPHGPPSGPYNSSMRSPASNMRASPNMRAASPNLRSASPNPNMRASPNVRAGELPYLPATTTGYPGSNFSSSPARGHANPLPRSTTPFGGSVYPPGHVLEGQPMSRSRPPSPMPGGPGMPFPQASPRMPGGMPFTSESLQLAAPEGFSRPVNMAVPFTPFPDTFVQGMNRFFDGVPRMPKILQAHDVLDDDWMRLMKDVALAWANRLPVPELSRDGQGPKNSVLVADLVDLWNVSFFLPRGVELVLYRGKERRTGQHSGTIDRDVPDFDESDDDLSLTDSEEISNDSASDYGAGRYNTHSRTNLQDPLAEVFEMGRQRRAAAKADRKKRRQEKNRRRRERKRDRKYWLCLTSVPMTGASYMNAAGYSGSGRGGYGVRGGGGGGY